MGINLTNFLSSQSKNTKMIDFQDLDHLDGLSISVVSANLYKDIRDDLTMFYFREGAIYASVYTQSKIVSENIKWNHNQRPKKIYSLIVNTRNANAFTGKQGYESLKKIADLTAKQLNPKLKIISKASEETSYKKLKLAGADSVIMPNKIGGDHMASLVVVPGILEFVDNLSIVGKSEINLEEISSDILLDSVSNKTIKDLDLRKKTGCSIIGYKDPKGKYIINPEAELVLEVNSKIIVLGKSEQIHKLNSLYNI